MKAIVKVEGLVKEVYKDIEVFISDVVAEVTGHTGNKNIGKLVGESIRQIKNRTDLKVTLLQGKDGSVEGVKINVGFTPVDINIGINVEKLQLDLSSTIDWNEADIPPVVKPLVEKLPEKYGVDVGYKDGKIQVLSTSNIDNFIEELEKLINSVSYVEGIMSVASLLLTHTPPVEPAA